MAHKVHRALLRERLCTCIHDFSGQSFTLPGVFGHPGMGSRISHGSISVGQQNEAITARCQLIWFSIQRRNRMADKSTTNDNEVSRERLAELLNDDLAREYQAIIGYVVYSQVLTGANTWTSPR